MQQKIKILHLEDLQSDAELINIQLTKANILFENLVVDTREQFVLALQQFTPDIILADHSLTAFNSMEALEIVKAGKLNIPFLLVTTAVSEQFIDNIIKEGAKGYILKDNLDKLPEKIKNVLDKIFLEKSGYPQVEVILEEKLYDLRMLEEMDDYDYLAEIISIFLTETPKELKEMHLAAKSKNPGLVANKAHKLKSSSGLIEANKLTGILLQIEEMAKSVSMSNGLINLVEEANYEYKKIESSLQVHLRSVAH